MNQFKEFKVEYKDAGNGTLEGYASTWIRRPDSYGDVVKEGAFTRTLKERWNGGKGIPLLWAHQMDSLSSYIGKADAEEDDKGLHFVASFDDTPEAQRVRGLYKDGRLSKFSFAFDGSVHHLQVSPEIRELVLRLDAKRRSRRKGRYGSARFIGSFNVACRCFTSRFGR